MRSLFRRRASRWNLQRRRIIMGLPALPFTFPDATTAYRRIAERVNNILSFRFDDSRVPTAAEAAVTATPTNIAWQTGALRYGAKGDGVTDDAAAWNRMTSVVDYQFIQTRTYLVKSKVQASAAVTLEGGSRAATLKSNGFPDYLLEIGASETGPNPNAGEIRRLQLIGAEGNKACLHLQQLSHMWRLDTLLFKASPCPALVVDNCWDSYYTHIDILQCTNASGNPATSASVILRNGCNNLYLHGVRIEQSRSGGFYIGDNAGYASGGAGPIYVMSGKIDCGFITQEAAAVTITSNGWAIFNAWLCAGINGQHCFDLQGELWLNNCAIGGGTGVAHIYDHRAYTQLNSAVIAGIATTACGVQMPRLSLGNSRFDGQHVSIDATTPAVVKSKIFPQRLVFHAAVTSVTGPTGNNYGCYVSPAPSVNNAYNGAYLVLNATGTQPRSRRKILQSFTSGLLTIAGPFAPAPSTDYSIEFTGGHATPISADEALVGPGLDLFQVLQTSGTIASPSYTAVTGSSSYGGMTLMGIKAANFPAHTDATGYYLIDEVTGEPFLIGYGVDGAGRLGTYYDRSKDLNTAHTFSIVAGYCAGVRRAGHELEWTFAGVKKSVSIALVDEYGFDPDNLPLWGFQERTGRAVNWVRDTTANIDCAAGRFFYIAATDTRAVTIANPINASPGVRYTLMIGNSSGGAMGTITFDSNWKAAAWPGNLANGENVCFDFEFDGTYFRQVTPYATGLPQ